MSTPTEFNWNIQPFNDSSNTSGMNVWYLEHSLSGDK